jgi:nicotinamide-nucleotide amidase
MDKDFLTVIRKLSDKLLERGLRLSIAESCTGGFISDAVTNMPGSSQFFDLGVVAYSEEAKRSVLGISASLLRKHGTVSEETAVAMAKGVRRLGGSDVSLAVTGVAGPEGIEGKEVGLVYMAVAIEDMEKSQGVMLPGEREEIKRQASLEALQFLNQVLRIWL